MVRSSRRMAVCVTLLICNLVFIWGNSLLPGELSGAVSGFVKELLTKFLNLPAGDSEQGHGLLRKLAHFTEFACLGVLFCWLFSMLRKHTLFSLLCGFTAACTDETIQCFVPDRGPAIKDVAIDTAGVAVGMGLLLAGYAIYQRIKNNDKLEETKV